MVRIRIVCLLAASCLAATRIPQVTAAASATVEDCNANGLDDRCDLDCGTPGGACDLAGCGQSHDCNANAVPDECEFVATFQGLGDLAGGDFSSAAYGVSADGTTVVGKSTSASSGSGSEAFQWTRSWGMVGLGYLPDYHDSAAYGVSADGSVVVGTSGGQAFRWTMSVGMVGLGDWWFHSTPPAVSADGSVVVGGEYFFYGQCPPREAYRWTLGEGMVRMGYLPGGPSESVATGVSADGSLVVGYSGPYENGNCLCLGLPCPCGPMDAFRWTAGSGMIGLGLPLNACSGGGANGVSADGLVVVGEGPLVGHSQVAFRWTADGGIVALGDLPGGVLASSARAVSRDGSVVVGHGESDSGTEAFIWDVQNGMRSLRDVLGDQYGLDLTGWTLTSAEDVSDDGRTIVGYGTNPDGFTEAWTATLPGDDVNANGVPDECEILGACCDHEAFSGCTDGMTRAQCVCPRCEWHEGAVCAEVSCSVDLIPALDTWGLLILSLLLLIGAKTLFAHRPAAPPARGTR